MRKVALCLVALLLCVSSADAALLYYKQYAGSIASGASLTSPSVAVWDGDQVTVCAQWRVNTSGVVTGYVRVELEGSLDNTTWKSLGYVDTGSPLVVGDYYLRTFVADAILLNQPASRVPAVPAPYLRIKLTNSSGGATLLANTVSLAIISSNQP